MSQTAIHNRQNKQFELADTVVFNSVAELDQIRELAHGASLEIFQLKKGLMQGTLAHVELGNSSLHSNEFSLSARGHGCVSSRRWSFIVFTDDVNGRFNSHQLEANDVFVYRPGAEFDGTIFGAFQDWVFTVDDLAIRNIVRRLSGADLQFSPASCCTVVLEPKRVADLRCFARNTLTMARETPGLLDCEHVRKSLEADILEKLAGIFIPHEIKLRSQPRSAVSHSRLIQTSEDFLSAQIERPVSIADLCTVTDSCERTVRNAFRSMLGVSPHAYLKLRRLHLARKQLERSNPNDSSVKSIASASGFHHPGHFSCDFRRFFGETPSQTLAKPFAGR